VASAHYLGLHKKTAAQWQQVREFVDPDTRDLFQDPAPAAQADAPAAPQPVTITQPQNNPWPTSKPQTSSAPRRPQGRQW
jgi:hypothetical protein